MKTTTAPDAVSARERLLTAADELFYGEGVHTVGIDRVIEHAGVAKATLYSAFGSKDGLIRAHLERRHEARVTRILDGIADLPTPRDKILGVFDVLADTIASPTFRGCAFVNASAESRPGGSVETMSNEARTWQRDLFVGLATEAGADRPEQLARQLVLLYDGAIISARMDHDTDAATNARAVAESLVDAAIARA